MPSVCVCVWLFVRIGVKACNFCTCVCSIAAVQASACVQDILCLCVIASTGSPRQRVAVGPPRVFARLAGFANHEAALCSGQRRLRKLGEASDVSLGSSFEHCKGWMRLDQVCGPTVRFCMHACVWMSVRLDRSMRLQPKSAAAACACRESAGVLAGSAVLRSVSVLGSRKPAMFSDLQCIPLLVCLHAASAKRAHD